MPAEPPDRPEPRPVVVVGRHQFYALVVTAVSLAITALAFVVVVALAMGWRP